MINLLDITTPECRKHNVIRLICKLWGRTTPKDIFYSTHSNHLQEWLFSLLQIEGAFQRLSRENPNAFRKIWEDIPDGWGDRDSCIKAALNTSSSWPSIENNFIRGNYPLSKINFPLLDLYVQMFEQNRGRIALSLGKKLGIPILGQAMEIPAKEYNFQHYPVYKFKTGALTKRFTHFQYADDSIVLPYPGKNYEEKDLFPLYHDYLIEANRQAAVFLVDSIPLADTLQKEITKIQSEEIFTLVSDNIKELADSFRLAKDFRVRSIQPADYRSMEIVKDIETGFHSTENVLDKTIRDIEYNLNSFVNFAPGVKTDIIFSAYYGTGRVGDLSRYNDISTLKGHTVFIFIPDNPNEESWVSSTFPYIDQLSKVNPHELFIIKASNNFDMLNLEPSDLQVFSVIEIIQRAIELGLDISKVDVTLAALAFKKNYKVNSSKFLIDNILDRRSILMISAASGVGKSIFAMNLGYALATKGNLINGWKVNEHCKVLHICDQELDERTYAKHQEKFKKLYPASDADFICERVEKWNLLKDEDQTKLKRMIETYTLKRGTQGMPVSVIIFDSLNRLAPGVHHEKNWEEFSSWLTSLLQENLSIILVHHSGKNKADYLGTSKIQNDVDVHIHLETIVGCDKPNCIPLNIRLLKNRRSWLDRTSKQWVLSWGSRPRWYEWGEEQLNWRSPEAVRVESIIRMRQEGLTTQQIADKYNRSAQTIHKFVRLHPEIPPLRRVTPQSSKVDSDASEFEQI